MVQKSNIVNHGQGRITGGRKIPHPHAHRGAKLSKALLSYRKIVLPTVASYAGEAAMTALVKMYLNDAEGDCVIAGGYHFLGVATANATGLPFLATDEEINADYSAIGGYVPGDPSTDNGCDEISAFQYWMTTGFADGSKLTGYAAIDGSNQEETATAIYLFEGVTFGVALSDHAVSQIANLKSGDTWDLSGPPNENNGHDFIAVGYDTTGVFISTWGMVLRVSWADVATSTNQTNGGTLSALLTPEEIAKGKSLAPNGVDWATLEQDLGTIPTTSPIDPPAPVPAPPPAPPVPPAPVPVPPNPDPTPVPDPGPEPDPFAAPMVSVIWPNDPPTTTDLSAALAFVIQAWEEVQS